MKRVVKVVGFVLLSCSSLNAHRVLTIQDNHILIDTDYGIGKAGNHIMVQRRTEQGIVNIGVRACEISIKGA